MMLKIAKIIVSKWRDTYIFFSGRITKVRVPSSPLELSVSWWEGLVFHDGKGNYGKIEAKNDFESII